MLVGHLFSFCSPGWAIKSPQYYLYAKYSLYWAYWQTQFKKLPKFVFWAWFWTVFAFRFNYMCLLKQPIQRFKFKCENEYLSKNWNLFFIVQEHFLVTVWFWLSQCSCLGWQVILLTPFCCYGKLHWNVSLHLYQSWTKYCTNVHCELFLYLIKTWGKPMLSHTEEKHCSWTFCLVKSAKGEAELYSSIEFCLAWGEV